MSLECQGCSSAPAPLGEAPWVISALLQSMVSVLVRRMGDISKQCLVALYSSLSPKCWVGGSPVALVGGEEGQARGE